MARRGRHESLVEEVCDAMVKLVRHELDAGGVELPTTAELCRRFGVSRPVMREALSRLEMQGMITVKHGVGLRVCNQLHRPVAASVSLLVPDAAERLRQTTAARLLVEVEIARMAATAVTEEQLSALTELQEQLRMASTDETAVEADMRFHRLLAESCGNRVLALMLESIAEFGRQSRKRTIAGAGIERAYSTHQAVLDAVRAHAPERAATAMREHLQTAMKDLKGKQL